MTEFAEYVEQRHERLLRAAYLLTRDRAIAEDLVQTALARAWLAWRRIDGDPDPYVYRIIANTHASWWRRRWRQEIPTGELPERPDGRDFTGDVGDRDALWTAIGTLSGRQRAVVVLHYFEQLPLTQVARVLGCSVGAVKSQLNRALTRLRVDQGIQETMGVRR
ncbi:SigE family RNA polymerase sigma factor [Streptosporangium sp. NPDC023963]|uniref:SigE family RNA polymerase sigma factor n=1 Tax=Streptosporangium sp. NPDC023963 TaxID=3155608 RepID=UPI00342A0EE2